MKHYIIGQGSGWFDDSGTRRRGFVPMSFNNLSIFILINYIFRLCVSESTVCSRSRFHYTDMLNLVKKYVYTLKNRISCQSRW